MKVLIFVLMAGLSLVFYQNCAPYEGAGKEDASSNTGSGGSVGGGTNQAQSLAAFELTLAQVTIQNCGTCHGVDQFPFFALPNAAQSHDTIIQAQLVDLDNPANSRLVQKIQLNHSGVPTTVAEELRLAIEDWATRLSF